MADKLILRPPGSLESKHATSFDSSLTTSDASHLERPDFLSGVRKGIRKLSSISTGPRPAPTAAAAAEASATTASITSISASAATEASNSSLDASQSTLNTDRPPLAPKKSHTRSTSDLSKPLPATPASPTIEQLLCSPFSPPYTPQTAIATSRTTTSVSVSKPGTAIAQPATKSITAGNFACAETNLTAESTAFVITNSSRTSTMDSTMSEDSTMYSTNKSSTNQVDLGRSDGDDDRKQEALSSKDMAASHAVPSHGPKLNSSGGNNSYPTTSMSSLTTGGSSQHLSGLMCNVHRTTGREPPPLVGATTTILGDKLYVFGGRILSRTHPILTADLYELDLIQRHWLKLKVTGDIPPPRYFHSVCALGETKLVCYGGMSPAPGQAQPVSVFQNPDSQPEVVVMSDVYIYDAPLRKWTFIPTQDTPQGRYAHCTTILPSSAIFCAGSPPGVALNHLLNQQNSLNGSNPSSQVDGTGGAEMVVVGGQDSTNHYIEQINIFNLRNMKWTSTQQLGKSCGAYRSVVAPLSSEVLSRLGKSSPLLSKMELKHIQNSSNSSSNNINSTFSIASQEKKDMGSSMLIYSNYNFLDVKLELQIRTPDGTLTEKPMQGTFSPPGLRFPNGGVIDTNFVVSGTYLTSSKQEYALWTLDLCTLTWSRIDAGGSVFSQGSWNRGVLWNRRNTFVILGNRKRSLVEDYNHRRINFANVCMVELEAFGLYDNPRKVSPMSGYVSASSPFPSSMLKHAIKSGWCAGGLTHSAAAEELGQLALSSPQLADMEILCVDGERVLVNSRIIAKRWGPYFMKLLHAGVAVHDNSDSATLRPDNASRRDRDSSITITPNQAPSLNVSRTSTLMSNSSASAYSYQMSNGAPSLGISAMITPPDVTSLPPNSRPRVLYLPHTKLTVQAMLYYFYTAKLPPSSSPLCTPQILCSLLQIARPYQIDGLLEAVVERLHGILDSRNAAAVFNASAMAAGGRSITSSVEYWLSEEHSVTPELEDENSDVSPSFDNNSGLRLSTNNLSRSGDGIFDSHEEDDEPASSTESASSDLSNGDLSWHAGRRRKRPVWSGGISAVIGLQKRGLRGLMEGRRLRERGTGVGTRDKAVKTSIGLGIAG